MSKPRPIHIPPREIATIPDESEPVCSSYEDEDSFPDEPHIVTRRNFGGKASRRNSTGSGISWAKDGSSSFIPKEYKRSGTGKPSRRRSRSCSDIHQHGKWKTNGSTPYQEGERCFQRRNSMDRNSSAGGFADRKRSKKLSRKRRVDSRSKLRAQSLEVEYGHEVPRATLERSSSEQSTGSQLQGALISPSNVDMAVQKDKDSASSRVQKHSKLNDLLDRARMRGKKTLMLRNLSLTASDIPIADLRNAPLRRLSLAGNALHKVPASLIQQLPTLKHLDLSQCHLYVLPSDQWHLPKLKSLNLSHNRLRFFPEESMLRGLPELRELNMYDNRIGKIVVPHSTTGLLAKLEILNLGYNEIESLPEDIDQIVSLKVLKVMNNIFTKVPKRICDMSLKTIDVSGNPVDQPPLETCKLGIYSMKRHYSEISTLNTGVDLSTVNDTLKVIFVGKAMMGKTSIIKSLVEGKEAVAPANSERTVGVDIYDWDPKTNFEHIDSRIDFRDEELAQRFGDVDVKFTVWDFAGQHVYHATHELFFCPRALYIVVWDMGATADLCGSDGHSVSHATSDDGSEVGRRRDRALEHDIDEKVQFWVDSIQKSAPGAAILPVASFADCFTGKDREAEAERRCKLLKQRLLKHEENRIKGIKQRLKAYYDKNKANDQAAYRLRNLQWSLNRPKLIFGPDENCVVRVSGTHYTGIDGLAGKIIGIATGRDTGVWKDPIFRGHVGAHVPQMLSEVKEAVRNMRNEYEVVEWEYFVGRLGEMGLKKVEDIRDALHFLNSIGEASFFGGAMDLRCYKHLREEAKKYFDDCSEEDSDDDQAYLSADELSIGSLETEDAASCRDDAMSGGLLQFVFLQPEWLVTAIACVLRHDLAREIAEARRQLGVRRNDSQLPRSSSFDPSQVDCPLIRADDACLLWQAKPWTKEAAERAQEHSRNLMLTPYEFLQLLLVHFGVFVPIDMSIDKVLLGGKVYNRPPKISTTTSGRDKSTEIQSKTSPYPFKVAKSDFFFLPSLLMGPNDHSEPWEYSCLDSGEITLCHSILFLDGVPPGLMERFTANVLTSFYARAMREDFASGDVTAELQLPVKEVVCWRTAFFIKVEAHDGSLPNSFLEFFCYMADRQSKSCVGSEEMGVGMRRLIISGKGPKDGNGCTIYNGGYLLIWKCIRRVMDTYGGVEYERHGFCPQCLATGAVRNAGSWDFGRLRSAVIDCEKTLRCCPQYFHNIETRLVAGPVDSVRRLKSDSYSSARLASTDSDVQVKDLLTAVVLIGLWEGNSLWRVGSGFIVDSERGLVLTACHTLINVDGAEGSPFGVDCYGLAQSKIVIGVMPGTTPTTGTANRAVFRYFARIVAKDPSIKKGECNIDACVLQITGRMVNDVGGEGEGCGYQFEIPFQNNPSAMKKEDLQSLSVASNANPQMGDGILIIGFNQGGEGRLEPGESLNRNVGYALGYICQEAALDEAGIAKLKIPFKPRNELVAYCPTIGGHSGGPCVNRHGRVIGILSHVNRKEEIRCYISPATEWEALIEQAAMSVDFSSVS